MLHAVKMPRQTNWDSIRNLKDLLDIIIFIIIIKKGRQCKAEREWYTPYQSEDPSPTIPTNRQIEKGKRVEDYSRDRAAYANKEVLALLLKPASPTPSNTWLARSFQRDTEKGIKVLLYCKVLQRGGAKVYRCATRAPRITRAGTYGPGRAPLRLECTGLHLIL